MLRGQIINLEQLGGTGGVIAEQWLTGVTRQIKTGDQNIIHFLRKLRGHFMQGLLIRAQLAIFSVVQTAKRAAEIILFKRKTGA